MSSVLRPWVMKRLTLQMQGTILTAIRGPDNEAKKSPSKPIVRAYRCVILNNALKFKTNTFMGDGSGLPTSKDWHSFFTSVDQYPFHWFMHFAHATEIVGYFHPNKEISSFWYGFYHNVCDHLHVNPETQQELEERLSGNGYVDDGLIPCPICGYNKTFGHIRCANCLNMRWDLADE